MDTSIFLARLLGPIFLVVGVAMLAQPGSFQAMLREFIESRLMMYLAAVLGLLGSWTLVLVHNVWVTDWRVIVTLMGWLGIMRAIVTIYRPAWIVAAGRALLRYAPSFRIAGLIDLALGLVLTAGGFAG